MTLKNTSMILALPLLFTLLSACTGPQKVAQCEAVDWFESGRRDGTAGLKKEELSHPAEECSHIEPDLVAYEMGRQAGLTTYCDPQNALSLGRSGLPASQICPPALEGAFKESYEKGKKIYELQQQNDTINDEMTQLYRSLRDPQLSPQKRNQVSTSLKQLESKLSRNKAQIDTIERRVF